MAGGSFKNHDLSVFLSYSPPQLNCMQITGDMEFFLLLPIVYRSFPDMGVKIF